MIKQKVWKLMSYTLLAAMVSSLFIISGCGDDDNGSTKFEPVVVTGNLTVLINQPEFKQAEGAPATRALDSLRKYVEFYGLTDLLGTDGITLFAPSNQAFVNLLTTTPGFPSNIKSISPEIVNGVLAYHVIDQAVDRAEMTSGDEYDSYFDQPDNCGEDPDETQIIVVNSNKTLFTGSSNEEIEIVAGDNEASNGYMHVVESVMIPPSVGDVLTPILPTVAATALLSSNFEILAGLITYADCEAPGSAPIVNILGNPAGHLTVFFPPDGVFASMSDLDGDDDVLEVITYLATNTSINTAEEIRMLILNHIYSGPNASDEINGTALATKTSLTMVNENIYDINTGATTIGGKLILQKDADTRDNGIVHAIGGILGL